MKTMKKFAYAALAATAVIPQTMAQISFGGDKVLFRISFRML